MSEIIKDWLDSDLLGRPVPYRIILPFDYEKQSEKRYPVLYLLHGLFGSCNNFPDLTQIAEYTKKKDLIVVFPEGENGWYSDSRTIGQNKFESYFWKELFPSIDKRYRTIASRAGRALAGISMGGYGAFKMAFRCPAAFSFAASMSGAFDAPSRSRAGSTEDWLILGESLISVFGEQTEAEENERDDLFKMIENFSSRMIAQLPELYFDCGDRDSFINTNRKMAETLKAKKILFEYCEMVDGAHDWDYWNKQLAVVLDKTVKILDIR